jgi:hypothetical protein
MEPTYAIMAGRSRLLPVQRWHCSQPVHGRRWDATVAADHDGGDLLIIDPLRGPLGRRIQVWAVEGFQRGEYSMLPEGGRHSVCEVCAPLGLQRPGRGIEEHDNPQGRLHRDTCLVDPDRQTRQSGKLFRLRAASCTAYSFGLREQKPLAFPGLSGCLRPHGRGACPRRPPSLFAGRSGEPLPCAGVGEHIPCPGWRVMTLTQFALIVLLYLLITIFVKLSLYGGKGQSKGVYVAVTAMIWVGLAILWFS